jgi:hypothetical protein
MTNTSTARGLIAAAAAENGWTRSEPTGPAAYDVKFFRGDVRVLVTFTAGGRVGEAERTIGDVFESIGWSATGKRDTVLAWLRRPAGVDAPLDLAQRILDGPVTTPTMGQVERPADQADPMDAYGANEAPGLIARDAIHDAADANGWAMYGTTHLFWRFVRGDVTINVSFTGAGAIKSADRLNDTGVRYAGTTGKRETVIEWLTEPLTSGNVDDDTDGQRDRDAAMVELADGEPIGQSAREALNVLAVNAAPALGDPAATAAADEILNRLGALEGQLQRATDLAVRDANRVRELEVLVSQGAELVATLRVDYRQARERITELEDQRAPLRAELRRSDDHGMGEFVAKTNDGVRRARRVSQPAELVVERAPTTAREALRIDGRPAVRPQLPGESTDVKERVPHDNALGHAMLTRIYGTLVRPRHGLAPEFLRTSSHRDGRAVPTELVLPYLAAIRSYGFPGPAQRLRILVDLLAAEVPAR